MKPDKIILSVLIFHCLAFTLQAQRGMVHTTHLQSEVLKENLVGLNTRRVVKVYTPPSYENSKRAYPVVYFLHNAWWSAGQVFEDGNMQKLLERAFATAVVDEFILVAADYSSPTVGSIYENSSVSGKWIDFTVNELVPFIDGKYRTLPQRESRALTGDFFGGYGALKLAIRHAETFGVAYGMHPVATGTGDLPWPQVPVNWTKLHNAKSYADLADADGRTRLFITICQAYLPNPAREPFHCDFFMEMENNKLTYKPDNTRKLKEGFLLDETLTEYIENMRSLRGLAFDWARFDEVRAHVAANREFSQQLSDLDIAHEAEEYTGTPWDKNWIPDGRFYTRVLPFFHKHLIFDASNQ